MPFLIFKADFMQHLNETASMTNNLRLESRRFYIQICTYTIKLTARKK